MMRFLKSGILATALGAVLLLVPGESPMAQAVDTAGDAPSRGLVGAPNLPVGQDIGVTEPGLAIDSDATVEPPDGDGQAPRAAGAMGDIEIIAPYPAAEAPGIAEVPGAGEEEPWWPSDTPEQAWWPEPPPSPAKAGPDLAVQKVAPNPCTPGKACGFVIVVTNAGDAAYSAPVRMLDDLPPGWALASSGPAGSPWSCQQFASQAICGRPALVLAPGQSDVLAFDVQVPAAQGMATLTNCAVIEHGAGAIDIDPANDRGCTPITIDSQSKGGWDPNADELANRDLELLKVAKGDCVAGELCPFTIKATNTGEVTFDGELSVVDILPAGWKYGTKDPGWWCILTLGGGDRFACRRKQRLEPGQSVDINIAVRPPATASGTDQNCAELDWSKTVQDDRPDNNRGCALVNLLPAGTAPSMDGVDLAVEKTLLTPPLTGAMATLVPQCKIGEACPFRFAVKVTNVGTKRYVGPVTIADLMPLGWTYEGMNGALSCAATGAFVSCDFGPAVTLDPGIGVVVILGQKSAPLEKATKFVTRNCASVTWIGTGDANSANDASCAEITVEVVDPNAPKAAGFAIAKTGKASCVYNVEDCEFTVWLANGMGSDFNGTMTLSDRWLSGWSLSGAPAGWTCSNTSPDNWQCSGPLSIAAGKAASSTWRFQAPAGFNPGGNPMTAQNCATLGGKTACHTISLEFDQQGPPAGTGQAAGGPTPGWASGQTPPANLFPGGIARAGGLLPGTGAGALPGGEPKEEEKPGEEEKAVADIRIEKEGVGSCEPGKRCDFIIKVRGLGEEAYGGAFAVTDTLPEGWTFAGGGKLGLWSCKKQGGETVCTYDIAKNPQLPKSGFKQGDVVGFGLQLNIPADHPEGIVSNCASIEFKDAPPAEGSEKNHKACYNLLIGYEPKLTVSKKFKNRFCTVGEPCPFTISVKNEGKGNYTGILVVIDKQEPTDPSFPGSDPDYEITRIVDLDIDLPTSLKRVYLTKWRGLKPGEESSLTIEGTIKHNLGFGSELGDFSAIKNCANLILFDTDPASMNYTDRLTLTRELLRSRGYIEKKDIAKSSAGVAAPPPFNEKEKQALKKFKADKGFITNEGEPDTSDEVTDEIAALALPVIRDARYADKDTKIDGDGRHYVQSCDTVLALPNLKITKSGPTDYETPDGRACRGGNHICKFTVEISTTNDRPHEVSLSFKDLVPKGWMLLDYSPKGVQRPGVFTGWSCEQDYAAYFFCHYEVTDAADYVTPDKPLKLELVLKGIDPVIRDDWAENCVQLDMPQSVVGLSKQYRDCARVAIHASDLVDFGLLPDGTKACTPPNCSFYQFSALAEKGAHEGPLDFTITPPPGSAFSAIDIKSTAPYCPASAWTCTRGGSGADAPFLCRIDNCLMSEGDRVTARIEGSVAPGMTEPPDSTIEKTACGTIKWTPRSRPGDIEQVVGTRQETACYTTAILAKPKPKPCPPGQQRNAAGICVPAVQPVDLAITKRTVGNCDGQEDCRFQITVRSQGNRPFSGRVAIRDTLSVSGATLNRVSGRASCSQSDRTIECIAEPGALATGRALVLSLDMTLPRRGGNRQLQNCAEIYRPGMADGASLSREEIRMLQGALDHLGYDPGPIDGVIGRRTRDAVRAARTDLGLAPGTQIDRALLARLLGGADAAEDTNPANDRSCIAVILPACGPGYGEVRATGECVCVPPRVERDGECVMPPPPPAPTIRCDNGYVDARNQCVCPANWSREVVGGNWYRCEPPPAPRPIPTPIPQPPTVRCDNGYVDVRNQCVCPVNWNREVIGRNAYRCVPPPVPAPVPVPTPVPTPVPAPIQCEGGTLLRGLCVCPPGQARVPLPNDAGFRCTPVEIIRPQPVPVPTPAPEPPRIEQILPALPQFQMLTPKCPEGQVYDEGARKCVTPPAKID